MHFKLAVHLPRRSSIELRRHQFDRPRISCIPAVHWVGIFHIKWCAFLIFGLTPGPSEVRPLDAKCQEDRNADFIRGYEYGTQTADC